LMLLAVITTHSVRGRSNQQSSRLINRDR
jgi:hypothetical protein